jgi:coenzyme F420 hydrogenase subunit beta
VADVAVVGRLLECVVGAGICTGCGACVALDASRRSSMRDTDRGPIPDFSALSGDLPELAWDACPGKGISYPSLYRSHFGALPDDWLIGKVVKARTGHAGDAEVRRNGASGGVTTQVLLHLLETGRIDGAIVVRQGIPAPELARVVIARTREDVIAAAQSVYIPVSTVDVLRELVPGERYAMTCLPDQAAAIRRLQAAGFEPAMQVEYLLGAYTGTALYPAAIRSLLRSKKVADEDAIASLRWRAGEWPGHLEIGLSSGRMVTSKKVYYNFLIPFFVTQGSLQGMDFANEFCDLSVGDAWSPHFEELGGGHSVFVTRSERMEDVIREMEDAGLLATAEIDPHRATEMHGHMIDFKKRGSYLRNRLRRALGGKAPDHGVRPAHVPVSRVAVELVIVSIFAIGRTRMARAVVQRIPERIIGPLFDRLRLMWKSLSRPTKRKGLGNLEMTVTDHG